MSLFARFFSSTPTVQQLQDHLREIDLEQKKKRRDLTMLEEAKQNKVRLAVDAKRAGRQSMVRELFYDVNQIEIDIGNANGDLRRLALTRVALTSFIRKAEMIEKKKDQKALQALVKKFRESSVQKTIDSASVDDDTFNDMLAEILGETEAAVVQSGGREEPGFAEFERAISEMASSVTDDVTPVIPTSPQKRVAAQRQREDSGRVIREEERSAVGQMQHHETRAADRIRLRSDSDDEKARMEAQKKMEELSRTMEEMSRLLREQQEAAQRAAANIKTLSEEDDRKAALEEQKRLEELNRMLEAAAKLLEQQQEAARRAAESIRTMSGESDEEKAREAQKQMEEMTRMMQEAAELLKQQQEAAKRAAENMRG